MAKSKSGGTRAYIRGKIGADVYSIGKDGKGSKQQVVRSLAEVVSNPQTLAQMRGRMIMSSVMQTVSVLSPIIDHSFDNVPNGQPSISEFISRNYALVKADVAAHPASGNVFGLVKYQEKGSKGGAYLISVGSVSVPSSLVITTTPSAFQADIKLPTGNITVGALKTALGLAGGDYFTFIFIKTDGSMGYCRVYISDALADTTEITSENLNQVFNLDQDINASVYVATNYITFESAISTLSYGVILSKKVGSGWEHSTSTMALSVSSLPFTADEALPTYPQGASRFLNGGDI